MTHTSDVFSVGRIPCIGERVFIDPDGELYEVKEVMHFLDADPETQVLAFVRVK